MSDGPPHYYLAEVLARHGLPGAVAQRVEGVGLELKVRSFPGLTTIQRHARDGVQDDTYLVESPFRSRDVSTVGQAAGRRAKRTGTRLVARDGDGRVVAGLAVTTVEETRPPSTTNARKVVKSKTASIAKPKTETTAARDGATPNR